MIDPPSTVAVVTISCSKASSRLNSSPNILNNWGRVPSRIRLAKESSSKVCGSESFSHSLGGRQLADLHPLKIFDIPEPARSPRPISRNI